MENRYSIVRVERECPEYREEDFRCPYPDKKEECLKCEQYRYGDTKEQLIRKVAQIRFKQETQYGSKDMLKAVYNMCYRQAKEIIEFLGVRDDTN